MSNRQEDTANVCPENRDPRQGLCGEDRPAELANAYAGMGSDYDSETLALGYLLPFLIAAWVARHVPTRRAAARRRLRHRPVGPVRSRRWAIERSPASTCRRKC